MAEPPIPVKEQLQWQLRLFVADIAGPLRVIGVQAIVFLTFFFVDALVTQLVVLWLDADMSEPSWLHSWLRQLVTWSKVVSTTVILAYLLLSTIEGLFSLRNTTKKL